MSLLTSKKAEDRQISLKRVRVNVRQKWNKKEGVGRGRLTEKFTLSWLVVAIHKAEIPMECGKRLRFTV